MILKKNMKKLFMEEKLDLIDIKEKHMNFGMI